MNNKSITKKVVPSHPSLILKEEMTERQLSIQGMARALHVPVTRIQAIVQGKRGISADTSARLGKYLGTSADYWLRVQVAYDMRLLDAERIDAEVIPAA